MKCPLLLLLFGVVGTCSGFMTTSQALCRHSVCTRRIVQIGPALSMKEDNWLAKINPFKPKPKDPSTALVDGLLKDAPLPVKMMGGLIKGFVGMAGEMLGEASDDITDVREAATRALNSDARVRDALNGGGVAGRLEAGPPISSSFSSSNVNGAVSKRISLQLPIFASSGAVVGTASVEALASGSAGVEPTIKRLLVAGQGSGQIDVRVDGGDGSVGRIDDAGVIDV